MRLLFVLLVACDGLVDIPIKGEADHGTVYRCASGAMCFGETEEWCWDGTEEELEALLGAECHNISIFDRAWPALVGCAYGCPLEGRGCNAHCGCFCE